MKEFKLFLGLNDKDTKRQEIDTINAYKILMNLLTGATIKECTGFYKHEDGTLIIEKSLEISIFDIYNNLNIDKIINDLKTLFNQESIGLVTAEVNAEFK